LTVPERRSPDPARRQFRIPHSAFRITLTRFDQPLPRQRIILSLIVILLLGFLAFWFDQL
jgi:hypothetical protein